MNSEKMRQMNTVVIISLLCCVNVTSPAALVTSRNAKIGSYTLIWNFVFPDNITSFSQDLNQQHTNPELNVQLIDVDGSADSEQLAKLNYLVADSSTANPGPSMLCEKPKRHVAEIYWKEYRGPPVPDDAFLVGYTKTETSVHVGQVYVPFKDGGLQPVAVHNNSAYVTSTFVRNWSTRKNIKILCTNVPHEEIEDFVTWIPTDLAWKLDPETGLVITGIEHDSYTYIGKTMFNDDLVVGKAARHNKGFSFFFPLNGKEKWLAKDFYVLAYKEAVRHF